MHKNSNSQFFFIFPKIEFLDTIWDILTVCSTMTHFRGKFFLGYFWFLQKVWSHENTAFIMIGRITGRQNKLPFVFFPWDFLCSPFIQLITHAIKQLMSVLISRISRSGRLSMLETTSEPFDHCAHLHCSFRRKSHQ
mgnify:CR=1 FL=1